MFKIHLENGKKEQSPYIYKWGMEWFGQVMEFSLSHKEFATFKEKTKNFFTGPAKVKPYLESVRNKIKEKRAHKKEVREKFHAKKNGAEREAVA